MKQNIARYLGQNIEKLRAKKSWSQQQLANGAGVPRSTLANIESGSGNPSLTNLIKISDALGVGVEELLSRPRVDCILIPANKVPLQIRNQIQIYKLLPDRIKGIEIDRLELPVGTSMGGRPHLSGTKEYLTVIQGEVTVYVAGEAYCVKKGDVFAFPGNQLHSYRNSSKTLAIAISVVIPIPASF